MSRDPFPVGGNGKTREAWTRRQIALAFGMRPHEAMLYLQGVVREAFAQGRAMQRGIARQSSENIDPPGHPPAWGSP